MHSRTHTEHYARPLRLHNLIDQRPIAYNSAEIPKQSTKTSNNHTMPALMSVSINPKSTESPNKQPLQPTNHQVQVNNLVLNTSHTRPKKATPRHAIPNTHTNLQPPHPQHQTSHNKPHPAPSSPQTFQILNPLPIFLAQTPNSSTSIYTPKQQGTSISLHVIPFA